MGAPIKETGSVNGATLTENLFCVSVLSVWLCDDVISVLLLEDVGNSHAPRVAVVQRHKERVVNFFMRECLDICVSLNLYIHSIRGIVENVKRLSKFYIKILSLILGRERGLLDIQFGRDVDFVRYVFTVFLALTHTF